MKSTECIPALRALGDPSRLKITEILLDGPLSVNELASRLGTRQYNVSKHVRILKEAGILVSNRRGKEVICEVAPEYRSKRASQTRVVNLGCCSFRFDDGSCA